MNIVVIGASGGIGAALVRHLQDDGGHRLFTISQKNTSCDARCDITDQSAVQSTFENMLSEGFTPECVIVASGVFEDDLIPAYNRALLDKNFEVNFFGVLNVIDAVLPHFLSMGKGQVIALSSIAALRPNKRGIGYPASKAALSLAMRGFDLAFRPKGIAFSVACIGPTRTNMWEGGSSFLVAPPEKIARCVATLIRSRKAMIYAPFLSTMAARIAVFIPDRLYMTVRKILLG